MLVLLFLPHVTIKKQIRATKELQNVIKPESVKSLLFKNSIELTFVGVCTKNK